MQKLATFLLFAAFLASSSALVRFGKCDKEFQAKQNFDLERYTGNWYQVARD